MQSGTENPLFGVLFYGIWVVNLVKTKYLEVR
jgi:hypothetical protein